MTNSDNFFEKVYDIVRKVPYGKVTSYGAIANAIGSPQSSRMVGWAMNNAHTVQPWVPAHRVVNRIGLLTGKHHFCGEKIMQQLLESEGVVVENDKVVNFNEVFWKPS